MGQRQRFGNWDEALTEALILIQSIPLEHGLAGVYFGTFAAASGGHYVDIEVTYNLGNTKRPVESKRQRAALLEAAHRSRAKMVIEAWNHAVTEAKAANGPA